MHAFLLVGREITNNNQQIDSITPWANLAIEQKAKVILFVLQKIEDARELKKFVKFSNSSKTAIVIENIDSATPETQNAFLKNLEEPNNNLIYILTASNLENVLPTITSRCEVIKLQNNKLQITNKVSNYKDALNIKDRDEAINFIENMIHVDHVKSDFKNMENYLKTIKNLKLNGNVSLQMTNLVVRMESQR